MTDGRSGGGTTDGRSGGGDRRRLRRDDRAVSVTVGYVLNLAVAALLLSGLFAAGGSFVEGERQQAIDGELTVVGERVAADLTAVDRLVRTAETPSELAVELEADLPSRTAGTGYRITVTESGTEGTVRLESNGGDVAVEVPFRSSADVTVANGSVAGGDLRIRYDAAADEVVVES